MISKWVRYLKKVNMLDLLWKETKSKFMINADFEGVSVL